MCLFNMGISIDLGKAIRTRAMVTFVMCGRRLLKPQSGQLVSNVRFFLKYDPV